MLSNLREKIFSVGKNVGLLGSKKASDSGENFNAGAELLQHFKRQWEHIHEQNEDNVKLADEVATTIDKIYTKIEHDKSNISTIHGILTKPQFTEEIKHCVVQINKLYEMFNVVEQALNELEDIIDERDYQNMKKEHKFHLDQYEIRKKEALVKYEEKLKENYARAVAKREENMKKLLSERQQVFQEAFNTDLEIYKTCGSLPKLDLSKKQPSALLEEIHLDLDQKELDQFFEEN